MPKRRDSAILSAKSTLKLPGERTKPLVPTGKIRQKNPRETFSSLREEQVENLCGKAKWPVYLDFHEDMFRLVAPDFLSFCKDVVKEIDFSSNLLSSFHSAQHLTKLRRLNLANNELVDARFTGLVSLEFLSLSRNKLDTIPDMVSLRSLIHLDLSSNTLQKGFSQFQHLKSLKVLDLSRNNLEITLSQLYHFVIVFLKRLPKLEYVSFEQNPISETMNYRPFVVSELPKLKYLDWKEVSKDERHSAESMDFSKIKDNIPASSPRSAASSPPPSGMPASASLVALRASSSSSSSSPHAQPEAEAVAEELPPPIGAVKSNISSVFDTPSIPPPQPPAGGVGMTSLDDILNEIGGDDSISPPKPQQGGGLDPLLDDVLGLLDAEAVPPPNPNAQPPHPAIQGSFDEKFGQPPNLQTSKSGSMQYFDDLLDVLDTPPDQQSQQQPQQPQQGGGEDPLQYFDDLFEILNENPTQKQQQQKQAQLSVYNAPRGAPQQDTPAQHPQLFDELTSILEDTEWSSNNKNNPSVLVPPPTSAGGDSAAAPPPQSSVGLPPPIASPNDNNNNNNIHHNTIDDELFDVLGDILDTNAASLPPAQPTPAQQPKKQEPDLMDELDMLLNDIPLDGAEATTKEQQQDLDADIAALLGETTRKEEEDKLREAEENLRKREEEERKKREEEERRRREEEERRKEEEDRRLAEEREREMERLKIEEERLEREELERQRRLEEERLIREVEEKRREEERQKREEARRRLEEEKKRRNEEARLAAEAELKRREEEEVRIRQEEERRRKEAEERLRLEEERRRAEAEERRRAAEEQRIQEEQERRRRQEEEERRKIEEEKRRREEEERREQERLEARRKAEQELAKRRAALEERKREAEKKRQEEEQRRRVIEEQRRREEEERKREEEEKNRIVSEQNLAAAKLREQERIAQEERRRQQDEEERRQWLTKLAEKEAAERQGREIDQYINMQMTGGVTSFGSLPEPEEANLPSHLVKEMKEAPSWELKAHDVVSNERLGTGTFGSVARGVWNHREVTVKTLNCQRFDQDFLFTFKQQVPGMVALDHPNVLQMLGVVTDGTLQTIGEFVHGVPLFGYLRSKGNENMGGEVAIEILRGIGSGLEYLHNNEIIHRSLKSKNIIMNEEGVPKIRDFGFAHIKDAVLASGSVAAPNYSAPEILVRIGRVSDAPVTKAVDIFSFGMLSWEVFTKQTPLGDMVPRQVLKAILAGERPPIIPCIPILLQRLIPAMWQGESAKRPTIDKILRILMAPLEKLLQYEPSFYSNPSASIPPSSLSPSQSFAPSSSSPSSHLPQDRAQSFSSMPSSPSSLSNLRPLGGVGGGASFAGGARGASFADNNMSQDDNKQHHVLRRLIDLLSAPYPQSQIKALKATANIAPTLTNPSVVKDSGIVPLIVNLQTGPDNVKENVLIALYAICSNELLCTQAVEAGVIQMCASFLHSQNNILVLNSTKIITKIAEFPQHREALRSASVIPALFQLLDNFNEAVKQQTLLAFCQLLCEQLCIEEFVKLGGGPKLAQLVHGNHPGIVLRSFVVLSMLYQSEDPSVQKAYRDSGVIGRFVAFLKSTTPMLFLEGSKGMARFSERDAHREEIARMGGIAPIIASLTNENVEATYYSCVALQHFCGEERYRKFIRQSGGVPILLAILQRRDAENAKELQVSAEVLALLVSDQEAGEQLVSQGTVPLLLGNLTAPSAEVRKATLKALSGAVQSDVVADSVGQSVSAHTFSALLNSSDQDVASDAVKVLARISQKSSIAKELLSDILGLVCELLNKDRDTSVPAATVLSVGAMQGNMNVGQSIIGSQTVHLFWGQLRVASDYELLNLLKGTSALVSEVQFGRFSLREGAADAIASVLKRKNPLFCSVAFRIILTLGVTPEAKLQLLESPVNAAIQELMADPGTDRRLVMAAEKVIETLHS